MQHQCETITMRHVGRTEEASSMSEETLIGQTESSTSNDIVNIAIHIAESLMIYAQRPQTE